MPKGFSPYIGTFFLEAKSPPNVIEIETNLSYGHFKCFALKQDERKMSSPSQVHYGHTKAPAKDDELL